MFKIIWKYKRLGERFAFRIDQYLCGQLRFKANNERAKIKIRRHVSRIEKIVFVAQIEKNKVELK